MWKAVSGHILMKQSPCRYIEYNLLYLLGRIIQLCCSLEEGRSNQLRLWVIVIEFVSEQGAWLFYKLQELVNILWKAFTCNSKNARLWYFKIYPNTGWVKDPTMNLGANISRSISLCRGDRVILYSIKSTHFFCWMSQFRSHNE